MSIKFGAGPIEFEKGKAGIVVPSRDKLPAVIDTLISAVRVGELDELFSQPRPDRSRRPQGCLIISTGRRVISLPGFRSSPLQAGRHY
jgi:hypothetical protein